MYTTIYEWIIEFWLAYFVPTEPVWETMDHIIQIFCFIVMLGIIFFVPLFVFFGLKAIRSIGGGRYDD
jgi:polyferredoxin